MRFRAKVLGLLVGTTVLTNAASIWLVYAQCRPLLYDEIRSKVLSIAATTAALSEGEEHERVRSRADEGSGPTLAWRSACAASGTPTAAPTCT